MSGDIVTQTRTSDTSDPRGSVGVGNDSATSKAVVAPGARPALGRSRAARELELNRGEFDLAVGLGRIRTVPDEGGGGRRVTRAEIDRVRSEKGFPKALRERVATVGTSEGAALMDVTTGRFTRFARLGLVVPVKFHLNRNRAVVWLYLAEELRQFAANQMNAPLLNGRVPPGLRDQLDTGLDLRARNWRGRHLGFSLRRTEDPWARAATVASLLDPFQVDEIVTDPYERAYLDRYRPDRGIRGTSDSPAALVAARIMTAADPDEIDWLRADLANALQEARDHRDAPRPTRERGGPPVSPVRSTWHGERGPRAGRRHGEPRQTTRLRHPAEGRGPAERRRPTAMVHPSKTHRRCELPVLTETRPSAETEHLVGTPHPVEARHAMDGAERPLGLLARLRRRSP